MLVFIKTISYICRILLFKGMIMNFFKNCGIFVLLIGELFLIIPFFMQNQTNGTLLTGWILIVIGFILYILINKKIR
jgi:hypothetical protein